MQTYEVENKGLDQSIFHYVSTRYTAAVCHQTMGFILTYLGKGIAGMKMYPAPMFSTKGGRVHGGIIATLADTVMSAAAATTNGNIYRTVDISLNYFAPVFEVVELRADGYVVHPGNTIAVVEASLYNNEGKLIAKSRGTFIRDKKFASLENE